VRGNLETKLPHNVIEYVAPEVTVSKRSAICRRENQVTRFVVASRENHEFPRHGLYFGNQLAQFYEIAQKKQAEAADRFTHDPQEYLEATLQLTALATNTISNAVRTLALLGSSNDIPANRIANWANVAPATLRAWEQEGERAVKESQPGGRD
jgi:hypothetical protein